VGSDQLPASRALTLDALAGGHLRVSDLAHDAPDAGKHGLVAGLDDQPKRDDVELIVVESGKMNARYLGEDGERLADARVCIHRRPPGRHASEFSAGSYLEAGIYDRGAKRLRPMNREPRRAYSRDAPEVNALSLSDGLPAAFSRVSSGTTIVGRT
jgi:hypothetical protein